MCLSEKEFGNVFLKQTREGREKEGENGSVSVFLRGSGRLCSMWGDFYTVDPEIPPACVCMHNHNYQALSFSTFRAVRGLLVSN